MVFALKADLPRHMGVWTVHRGETLLAEDTNPYDALLRAGLFTAVGPKAETTVDLPAVLHRGRQGVLRLMTREQALAPYRPTRTGSRTRSDEGSSGHAASCPSLRPQPAPEPGQG